MPWFCSSSLTESKLGLEELSQGCQAEEMFRHPKEEAVALENNYKLNPIISSFGVSLLVL